MAAKTKLILESVGHELKEKEPSIVKQTREKYGPARAAKQKTAILLSKARRQGAHIPRRSVNR